MRFLKTILIGANVLLVGSPVQALERYRIAGHEVRIDGDFNDEKLEIDGRLLHSNAMISIEDVLLVDSTLTVIGSSSAGGNACDSSPFILSFPKGQPPKFDGPIDSCVRIEQEIHDTKIVFANPKIPGQEQQSWEWTPARGFRQLAAVPFKPDSTEGWNSLRDRRLDHPADAFLNGDINQALMDVLGADFDQFQQLMTGVGGGEFKGDDYVGSACRPHDCPTEGGMIYLSLEDRKAFAAWKRENQTISVYPPEISNWPSKPRLEFNIWKDSLK